MPCPCCCYAGSWQSGICEVAGGITKANGTYYLVYHCLGNADYSSGVSTASHPLGPWSLTPEAPALPHGPCLNILKDPDRAGWISPGR